MQREIYHPSRASPATFFAGKSHHQPLFGIAAIFFVRRLSTLRTVQAFIHDPWEEQWSWRVADMVLSDNWVQSMLEIGLKIHLELGILNFHTNSNERVWKKALYWKWQLRATQQISGVPALAIPKKNKLTGWWIIHRYWVLKPLCLFFSWNPMAITQKSLWGHHYIYIYKQYFFVNLSTYIYISLHYPYIYIYIYITYTFISPCLCMLGIQRRRLCFAKSPFAAVCLPNPGPPLGVIVGGIARVRPIVVDHFVQPFANFIINGLQQFCRVGN